MSRHGNTADTGGPGRHARTRQPRADAARQGGSAAVPEVPGTPDLSGWPDEAPGRHAQDSGASPAGTGHEPVARRTATGWRVGDEEVSDLTSAMVLADLLAAELPTQAMPSLGTAGLAGDDPPDPRKLEQTVAQLEHALTARVRVEQAIGVLAERHRLRPRQAFELLRSVARARGRRVLEMATEVVDSATNPLLRIPEELAKPPMVRRRGRRLDPDPG
jgi:ANTAR domain-containing protein